MGEQVIVCHGCDRAIETCAFCENDRCGEAVCYRCLIVELGESIAEPHAHGG
jgi:hypothetical protein